MRSLRRPVGRGMGVRALSGAPECRASGKASSCSWRLELGARVAFSPADQVGKLQNAT